MLKFRIMYKLHKDTLSWNQLKTLFPKVKNIKLYRSLNSLSDDRYIRIYSDEVYGTCYKLRNSNSFRDYIRMLILLFLKIWYNSIMVLGSIAAIITLVLTLLSITQ